MCQYIRFWYIWKFLLCENIVRDKSLFAFKCGRGSTAIQNHAFYCQMLFEIRNNDGLLVFL